MRNLPRQGKDDNGGDDSIIIWNKTVGSYSNWGSFGNLTLNVVS